MTQEVLAVGADGIPNGWVAAVCRGPAGGSTPEPCDLHTELLRFGSVGELVDWRNEHACGATAGVDVPMGLLENGGPRPCDQDARRLLQRRASSVFTPPGRYLLEAMRKADHAARWTEAQRLVRERGAVGISRQTLGIMGKIKEADDHLRARPEDQAWLIEVHPELSFLELSEGNPLPGPKRSAAGLLRRLDLVTGAFLDVRERIEAFEFAARVSLADILDAYAAAWSALRWHVRAPGLRILGDEQAPSGALAMRIVA